MANISANFASWSTTANSNEPDSSADTLSLRGDLQQIQATVRKALAYKGTDIASASMSLVNTDGYFHDVTGTTAITAFGTVDAGITKVLKFEGALTLTHNATSLIIPGGSNITTANGDMCQVTSEGGGNWRVNWYYHADGRQVKAFTGDSGSGGVAGLVPAPSAGDAAASKFLSAAGTWSAVSGGSSAARNYAQNGTFQLFQRAAPTTDNSYCFDRWRLMLGAATAATVAQDTADKPNGAYASCRLTVGATNNNKFGIFQVLESINCAELAGQTVSIIVPMKATAGITDARIGIMQWTSTADSVSADPVSAWNTAGTNPTLIANWAFANTPSANTVTTSWADYTVINVTLSSSMTNLGILIWCDDTTTTTTTDILRIGGYVTLCKQATAPTAQTRSLQDELSIASRYYQKTFPLATAPAQNAGLNGSLQFFPQILTGSAGNRYATAYPYGKMRTAPTITFYNPSAASAEVRNVTGSSNCTSTTADSATDSFLGITYTSAAGGFAALTDKCAVHFQADAEL